MDFDDLTTIKAGADKFLHNDELWKWLDEKTAKYM